MQNNVSDLESVGARLHVHTIISGLRSRGHQVRFVCPRGRQVSWTEDFVNWHDIEFRISEAGRLRLFERVVRRIQSEFNLPYLNLFESFRYADACHQALAGFDLLYERYGWMGYGGGIASRWMRIPLILEVNGDPFSEGASYQKTLPLLQRWTAERVTGLTMRLATRVVVVSNALKDRIVDRLSLNPHKALVVHNGADVELFSTPQDDKPHAEWGCGDSPTIVFVGSFKPWHGIDLLVEGFDKVHNVLPDVKLVLVGDGPGRPLIEQQVASLGLQQAVSISGVVDHQQVASLVGEAEVAVASYPKQGNGVIQAPLKIVEYMAAGKAIVAPRMQSFEVLEDGKTAVLVEPGDADELAMAILELLNDVDLRERLGQAAAREARTKYSWKRSLDELEQLCNQLTSSV